MMKYGQTEAPTEMAGLHIQYQMAPVVTSD